MAEANDFQVSLEVFEGPFDLLLSLITKHELDITEVALSVVTDEFINYVSRLDEPDARGLDRASEFLVVAATLLDLKIASLLPQGEAVDAEEIALLEARDLLFARLLQYRAFKQASSWFAEALVAELRRNPRQVALDQKYRGAGPELKWTVNRVQFAALAAAALAPKTAPTIGLDHLHAPVVSIREQAAVVVALLKNSGNKSFRELVYGVSEKAVVVARFLAILELYRRAAIAFEQQTPLGELNIRWTDNNWQDAELETLGADYDS